MLSAGETVDLDVVWGKGAKALGLRLLARWNAEEECHTLLVTNLARSRFSAEQVGQLYRLRWQVELLFKEWKSYANLHAFDTSKAGGDSRGIDMDGDCGVGSEALSGSDDAGIARG